MVFCFLHEVFIPFFQLLSLKRNYPFIQRLCIHKSNKKLLRRKWKNKVVIIYIHFAIMLKFDEMKHIILLGSHLIKEFKVLFYIVDCITQ